MSNLSAFETEFSPRLGRSPRWKAFHLLAQRLLAKGHPISIIETGCVRDRDNWLGDGCSTFLWSWLATNAGGSVRTVDINPAAIAIADELPNVSGYALDSIFFLTTMAPLLPGVDLLFLDSYDYSHPFPLSELHHAGELAAAYEKLPSGCLIAVDDCHDDYSGKHILVKAFFDRMNIKPILSSYITIWEKP